MYRSVTFTEYRVAKEQNPNKNDSEIFNIAWKETEDGIKYYKRKKVVIKTCQISGIFLASYLCFSAFGQVTAFADIVNLRLLKFDNPELFAKIENVATLFRESAKGLNIQQQNSMLEGILKRGLTPEELSVFNTVSEGMEVKEVLNFFKTIK